jgi:hypothetical protein
MTRLPAPLHTISASAALALSLALALPASAQSEDTPEVEASSEATPLTKGEQQLAKLLEGRVAGKPVSCIRSFRFEQSQAIDGTAYVYGRGSTIYVQRTKDPARIDASDTLVVLRYNPTEICRLDQTTSVDPYTGIVTGVVFFEDFVPYTRVKGTQSSEG